MTETVHRAECRFGPGFYRLLFSSSAGMQMRYCQTQDETESVRRLLRSIAGEVRVERDGYCLDGDVRGDARTPDVVDAEQWLAMPREQAMRELGLELEAEYTRAYRAIEDAVLRRDNRASQGGVRASILIKRKGARVVDV